MSRRAVFSLVGILVLLAASTPAMTAPEEAWSPPMQLAGWQDSMGGHRLLLAEDGTQAAFWLARTGSGSWALWARVRPPGEGWGPSANLSGWRENLVVGGLETYWDAGVQPDGSAVALWAEVDTAQTGRNVQIMSARRPPGGGWQVTALSDGYDHAIRAADLDIGPGGHMAAVWVTCESSAALAPAMNPCRVCVRRSPAGAETWLPEEHPSTALHGEVIYDAFVLVGPGGLTTVVWHKTDTSIPAKLAVMARSFKPEPAPGAWDASPVNLSGWKALVALNAPVTDPGGTVTVAWLASSPDPAKRANYASTRAAATGMWSEAVPISRDVSGYYSVPPILAAGQNGTVVAVWSHQPVATESHLLANVRDAGAVWGEEVELNGGTNLDFWDWYPRVWPDGSAMLLYSLRNLGHDDAEDTILRWTVRGPSGTWGDGGQGTLTDWLAMIRGFGIRPADDGSAVAAWCIEVSGRPAGEKTAIFAATWPPEGPFREAVRVSDWSGDAWAWYEGLVLGREGQPAALLWEAERSNPRYEAVYYSELLTGGNLVYVPLGLNSSP